MAPLARPILPFQSETNTICFAISLCVGPDLDGHRAPKLKQAKMLLDVFHDMFDLSHDTIIHESEIGGHGHPIRVMFLFFRRVNRLDLIKGYEWPIPHQLQTIPRRSP